MSVVYNGKLHVTMTGVIKAVPLIELLVPYLCAIPASVPLCGSIRCLTRSSTRVHK